MSDNQPGQVLLEALVDEGPQSVADLVPRLRARGWPNKKGRELSKIVGGQLSHLATLGQVKIENGRWILGGKFELDKTFEIFPGRTITVQAKEVRKRANLHVYQPPTETKPPADEHLFVGYLGGAPQDYPEIHPFADLFPVMPVDELRALCKDIKENGLREPITFWRGQLLDGRNRYLACRMSGVHVREEHLPDTEDPFRYVCSKNIRRRQLSKLQLAIVAEKAATATRGRRKKGGGTLTLDEAADMVGGGVGRRSVAMVREIKEADAQVYEDLVNGGYKSIHGAARDAGLLAKSKPKPTAPKVAEPAQSAPEPAAPTATMEDLRQDFTEWRKKDRKGLDPDASVTMAFVESFKILTERHPDRIVFAMRIELEKLGYRIIKEENGSEIPTGTGNGRFAQSF